MLVLHQVLKLIPDKTPALFRSEQFDEIVSLAGLSDLRFAFAYVSWLAFF
jgi:hypothetical protein